MPSVQPTSSPTGQPTGSPTGLPSAQPSAHPTTQPTSVPTMLPSAQPTSVPTTTPSSQPTGVPTSHPTSLPTSYPSAQPTVAPTSQPSVQPTGSPTGKPTGQPTGVPTRQPTVQPTSAPTSQPTGQPTRQPTRQPTGIPSSQPTGVPTTSVPTSSAPTSQPSSSPTTQPSVHPTGVPTGQPTSMPSGQPTTKPSVPTSVPTSMPSLSTLLRYKTSMEAIRNWHRDIITTTWVTSDAAYSGETSKFSFSEVDVYDVRREGTCSAFTELFSGAASKTILYKPSAIVLSAINTLPEVYVTQDLLSIDVSKYSAICKDSVVLQTIVTRINSDYDQSLLEVACDGRTWKVNACSGHADDAGDGTAICVDCIDPCEDRDRCSAYNASTFAVAPCNRGGCSAYLSANDLPDNDKAAMLSLYFQDKYPPPGIVELTTSSAGITRTSLNISLELNSPGTVYCGVFDEGTVPASAEEIVLQNYLGFVESDFDGDGNFDSFVLIDQLMPATSYDVYCMPYSKYGTKSELATALKKNVTASTSCCRMVSVSFPTSIYEGSNYYRFLKVELGSKPSASDFVVHVDISSYAGGVVQSQLAIPESFALDSSVSLDVPMYSSLKAGTTGTYFVNVTFSGAEADNWNAVYQTGTELTLLSTNFPQPAPFMLSAVFADDGTSIFVTFSGSTNYGSLQRSFTCSDLFEFVEISSGNVIAVPVSRCTWESAATVKLWTGSDATLWPESYEVRVVPGNDLISACTPPGCNTWPRVDTSSSVASDYSATIATAIAPVTPQVSISAPVTIGSCDDVELDISSSSGSGGRRWTSISFSVTSTGSAANTSLVQDYLDSTYNGRGTVKVPYEYLISGLSYGFSITLCNFFGKCAMLTHQASKLDTIMPAVKIFGSTLRSGAFRPSSLELKGVAGVASCGGTASLSTNSTQVVTTEWRVLQNNVEQTDLTSQSSNPTKFKLAPYTLTTGLVYEVQFLGMITSDSSAPRISTSSVTVYVEASDLVPVVLGGLNRNLPLEGTLTIDASDSYDLDQDRVTGVAAGLSFSWSCMQLEPMSDTCLVSLVGGDGGSLEVYAGDGSGETVSLVTMTMKDSAGVRSATKDIQITVLDPLQPVVELDSSTMRQASSGKVSPSASFFVQGDVSLLGTGRCVWTVDDESFDLAEAALVPVSKDISRTGATSLDFVIAPFTLPNGATLVFTLTCTQYASAAVYGGTSGDDAVDYSQMDDQVGMSSIQVEVNSPPSPGEFAVSPTYGTELRDFFRFASSLWNDDDIPITYQYSFLSPGGNLATVQTRSESASRAVMLPAGNKLLDYELLCVATIFDSLDANTTANSFVYVNETEDAAAESKDLLDSVSSSDDVDKVFAAVSTTMTVMNTVNCTLAPNCTLLHRNPCAKKKATCGMCLDGYSGVIGESNAACYDKAQDTESRRRLGTFGRMLPSLLSSGGCNNDDDCSGFETCSSVGLCELQQKSCPGGDDETCSGQGVCKFFAYSNSAAGATQERSECFNDDYSCLAECVCNEGYGGSSCESTWEELEQREAARALAVDALMRVFNSSGLGETIDGVTSALLALAEVSQDFTELPYNSTQQLMSLLNMLAANVLDNGFALPYDKIGLFMDVVEKVAARQEAYKNLYLKALNDTPSTHNIQLVSLSSDALVDSPEVFTDRVVDGTFTLIMSNVTESGEISARASEEELVAGIGTVPVLATFVAAGSLSIAASRVFSSKQVESDGHLYEATYGVPGSYSLSCVSPYSDCGFSLLPPGDLIMLRGEVGGPYGDYHGRWYRVHSSYEPGIDPFLPLAEVEDSHVPTTYKGPALNGTLLRWAHGYSYLVTFSGSAVESDPWLVGPLSPGATSPPQYNLELIPSVASSTMDPPVQAPNNTGLVESQALQELMQACGEMVTSSMVPGQSSYVVVKAGFRMVVNIISSVEAASEISNSSVILQAPMSSIEQALASALFSVNIPMMVLEDGQDAENVAVVYMVVDASLFELDTAVESDVVLIELSSLPMYFDESISVGNKITERRFNVTIPAEHSQTYEYPVLPVIETLCGDDEWSTYNYHCEDVVMADPVASVFPNIDLYYDKSQWITVTCNGTYSIIQSMCDLHYVQPTCDAVSGAGTEYAELVDAGCVLAAYDDTSTTCSCLMTGSATTRRRRHSRRLQDGNSTESVELNYVALSESAAATFTSTWSSAGELSADSVEDGIQVLIVMSALILLIVMSLLTVHRWDRADRLENDLDGKRKLMIKEGAVGPEPTANAAVPVGAVIVQRIEEKRKTKKQKEEEAVEAAEKEEADQEKRLLFRRRKIEPEHWRKVRSHVRNNATIVGEEEEELAFIEQTLPSVFHSKPFFARLLQELKSFHRWACIVWHYSETFPRSLRVVSMASNIIVTIFIQALTYNFTNPDDGTCLAYQSADACLADPSTFDNDIPKCYWVPRRVGGKCHFREPEDSLSVVVFVAVFSACVAIPILVSLEWVLKNVLSAKSRHTSASNKGSLYKKHLEKMANQSEEGEGGDEEGKKKKKAEGALMSIAPAGISLATRDGEAELHPALLKYAQSTAFSNRASQVDEDIGGTRKSTRKGSKKNETWAAGGQGSSPPPAPRQRQRRRNSLMNMLTFSQATDSVLTTSLQDDLGNVIEGIRKYRITLLEDERAEFDAAWGIDSTAGGFRNRRSSSVANIRDSMVGVMRRQSTFMSRRNGTAENQNQSSADGAQGNRAWLTAHTVNSGDAGDVQQRITQDLEDVRNTVDDDYTYISTQPALVEDLAKGKHLLTLFQRDLLPGINGQILASKNARDQRQVLVVSPVAKIAGWALVALVNLGMLFYIYLFAMSQTQARQGAWLQSFIVWFVMEVFIVSTVVCYVTHFLIPSVIAVDLNNVKRRLLDTIRDYNERLKKQLMQRKKARRDSIAQRMAGNTNTPLPPVLQESEIEEVETPKQHRIFNAAQYFFVSYRLAAKYPQLKESRIIRAFHTPWPRVSYHQSKKDVKQSYNALATSIGRSVAMVVFYLLGNLVQLPASAQDILIGIFCTAAVGYTTLLHISLYEWLPVLVVIPTLFFFVLVHFIVRWNDQVRKIRAAKTTPIRTDDAEGGGGDVFESRPDRDKEHGEIPLLTEEALRNLEKMRPDAYSVPLGALPKLGASKEDNQSSSSSSNADPDGGGSQIQVRTSFKRGSVGSLASLDTADQFSDLSYDVGTPGVSPTIGGAHIANHDVSSSAPTDSNVSAFRRASISRGLETMQALIGAQEQQLGEAETLAAATSDSSKLSLRQRLSFKKEGSIDSVKYVSTIIAEGDDEADSSLISSSSSSGKEYNAKKRVAGVVSAAAIAAGKDRGGDSDSTSCESNEGGGMYQVSSDEDSSSPLHLAKGTGSERPSKFALLLRGRGASKKKIESLQIDTSSSSGEGSGEHNHKKISIRIKDKDKEKGAGGTKQVEFDTNPEVAHPPGKPSFSAPLQVAGVKSSAQVPSRHLEPLSPTKQQQPLNATETATKLEALQSRMEALEERHAALQGVRTMAVGTPPENTTRSSLPDKKDKPSRPPKPLKGVTRGLIASGRLTGGLKKGLRGPVSGLKAAAAPRKPEKLEPRKVDAAAILQPTEFHGHDDLDF